MRFWSDMPVASGDLASYKLMVGNPSTNSAEHTTLQEVVRYVNRYMNIPITTERSVVNMLFPEEVVLFRVDTDNMSSIDIVFGSTTHTITIDNTNTKNLNIVIPKRTKVSFKPQRRNTDTEMLMTFSARTKIVSI